VHRRLALLSLLLLTVCRTTRSPSGTTEGTAAGIDPSLLEPQVGPCDDFYAYACGGWLAKTTIPPDKPNWSRSFSQIEESNLVLLRDIVEKQAAGHIDPEDRYARKVGDFFAACMDEDLVERNGTGELKSAFARIDAVEDAPALAVQVALLHRDGVFPAFRIESDQDAMDATRVIGVIEQGGLSLPDREYYLRDDPKSVAIQRAYRRHVAKMLELAGLPVGRAEREAGAIYRLEQSMASAQWTRAEMRDPHRVYNRVELVGLERAMPRFPWKEYLAVLGHPALTTFSTTTPKYLAHLDNLLAHTPLSTWRAYLRWHVLSSMATARALPNVFFAERFAFQSKNFTGAKEQEPRWKHCVHATERALGEAIGQAYVRRYFGADGKKRTTRLVSNIELAMRRDLASVDWMDERTRARALGKLDKVNNKVGYPSVWRNYDALNVDRSSFFRDVLASRAFEVNRDLAKIGKPLDRNEWEMIPPDVNAYYNPSMNEMVFPAGILQPPFFTKGAPEPVNYGAIGMVVGHELTHGFDDEGRQFDADGNLVDWWTPKVGQEFDRRAECIVKQYGDYVAIDDVKLNGRLTLGENIADLGGLKLAFAAYKASSAGTPRQAQIAGFTPEQAFFIAFAQSWCTAVRPEFARMRAQVDPHSPPKWRVNGPLSNLPEFGKAFSCPAASRMVHQNESRCEIW